MLWVANGPLLGGAKLNLDVALVDKPFLCGKRRRDNETPSREVWSAAQVMRV